MVGRHPRFGVAVLLTAFACPLAIAVRSADKAEVRSFTCSFA